MFTIFINVTNCRNFIKTNLTSVIVNFSLITPTLGHFPIINKYFQTCALIIFCIYEIFLCADSYYGLYSHHHPLFIPVLIVYLWKCFYSYICSEFISMCMQNKIISNKRTFKIVKNITRKL